ncbi:MAG: orotidine-5'-phosphate decarboxylase [Proteobacteria bacterium]|nr:orotidine-5'-phosphate decarboxylase [Pseudomonadota bacterium]MDA1063487.1 orotidine-5'-phosphate decarboxylase [Pseudomonadota bacterium]
MTTKNIADQDRLIFALDVPDCARARELATELDDAVTFYKIGLELMMTGGYFELLEWLLERDKKVFCDLKFFDIPATVGSAVRQLKDRGASFVTVHGNQSIMEAAAANKGDSLKVLGVTVLTSLDRGDLDDLGFACDIEELVISRARRALQAGCDGVISSGLEVAKLRAEVDSKLLVITPGIRPVDNKPANDTWEAAMPGSGQWEAAMPATDQKRVVTVESAFANGADYIVVGRPIRDAADPRAAAEAIQATIASQMAAR